MLLHTYEKAIPPCELIRDCWSAYQDRSAFGDYCYGLVRVIKPISALIIADRELTFAVASAVLTNGIGSLTILVDNFDNELDFLLFSNGMNRLVTQIETSPEKFLEQWGGKNFEFALLQDDVLLPLVNGTALIKDSKGQFIRRNFDRFRLVHRALENNRSR